MKRAIFTALAGLTLVLASVSMASAAPPFGNDGDLCHGHNQIECRPDPQPSHGQDCASHGHNTDGNDDHCASPSPSSTPSPSVEPSVSPEPSSEPTPSAEPSSEPSVTPSPTSSATPTLTPSSPATPMPSSSIPGMTPPPTDTATTETTASDTGQRILYWLGGYFVVILLAAYLRLALRRGNYE